MVYAPQRNWQRAQKPSYSDTAVTKGIKPSSVFSVDNKLLTTDRGEIMNKDFGKSYIVKDRSTTDSKMLVGIDTITFQRPRSIGTTEEMARQVLQLPNICEESERAGGIAVKHNRHVLFSKEMSLSPQQLRKIKPRILLDDRFLRNDGDDQ